MTDEHDDRRKTIPPDFVRYLNVRSATGVSFAPDGRRLTFLTDNTGIAEVWSVADYMKRHKSRPATLLVMT